MPSQSSPFFPIAAVVDPRFTTVDIAAFLAAFGVVPDCIQKMQRRMRDRRHQSRVLHCCPPPGRYFRLLLIGYFDRAARGPTRRRARTGFHHGLLGHRVLSLLAIVAWGGLLILGMAGYFSN
jgi:hypothetical protein